MNQGERWAHSKLLSRYGFEITASFDLEIFSIEIQMIHRALSEDIIPSLSYFPKICLILSDERLIV